jgi:coenzyme F420-reducing hydrogenase alpha subunit
VDADGKVVSAKIMPPTSQNQRQIELDLRRWLPPLLQLPDQQIADACEKLIRTWDPCISCSTHFLKIRIDRSTTTNVTAAALESPR